MIGVIGGVVMFVGFFLLIGMVLGVSIFDVLVGGVFMLWGLRFVLGCIRYV